MSKWLARVPNPDLSGADETPKIYVGESWFSKIPLSCNPSTLALREIQKHVERKVEAGLAAAAWFKRCGREEASSKAWAAAEALNELAKEIDRRALGQTNPHYIPTKSQLALDREVEKRKAKRAGRVP